MKIMENSPYAALIRYPLMVYKKAEVFESGVKSLKHRVACFKKDKAVAMDFKHRCGVVDQEKQAGG